MRYVKDSKEHLAQDRRIEEEKQATYNKIIRRGASNKAREWFKRPAYSVPFKKQED